MTKKFFSTALETSQWIPPPDRVGSLTPPGRLPPCMWTRQSCAHCRTVHKGGTTPKTKTAVLVHFVGLWTSLRMLYHRGHTSNGHIPSSLQSKLHGWDGPFPRRTVSGHFGYYFFPVKLDFFGLVLTWGLEWDPNAIHTVAWHNGSLGHQTNISTR